LLSSVPSGVLDVYAGCTEAILFILLDFLHMHTTTTTTTKRTTAPPIMMMSMINKLDSFSTVSSTFLISSSISSSLVFSVSVPVPDCPPSLPSPVTSPSTPSPSSELF